jgi:hypothetical protein
MNNQPKNLANKLNEEDLPRADNEDEDVENPEVGSLDEEEDRPGVADADEPAATAAVANTANIKNVNLTGNGAAILNPTRKAPGNNLTRKNKTNPSRNLTMRQGGNNQGAGAGSGADEGSNNEATGKDSSNDVNIMRSLNKVAMNLLNHQIVMKLFHFQTELYGAHKASDAYIEKFASTMDKFLEIAQGIYGRLTIKKFKLEGSSHTDDNIMKHIEGIIALLRTGIDDVLDNYTDLINVRDELVGDAEQLKYLLSFK